MGYTCREALYSELPSGAARTRRRNGDGESQGGKIVARETLGAAGKLFVLPVAPGNYTIGAKIANGVRLRPVSVTVRKGYTVRHDLFEDVP